MTRNPLLAALVVVLGLATVAEARPRPQAGKAFESNKTFGAGLELGEPTGLNGKYFLSSDRAIDFGIGEIYGWRQRDGLHLYADYLFHPVSLVSADAFELPLYIGIGARVWDLNDYGRRNLNNSLALGVRVPIGISFDFNNVPLDIFVQVAFVLDFYTGDYYRTVYGDVNGSVGIRYWFK